jgi:hypothetical protein
VFAEENNKEREKGCPSYELDIVTRHRTYFLRADSEEEQRLWKNAFAEAAARTQVHPLLPTSAPVRISHILFDVDAEGSLPKWRPR